MKSYTERQRVEAGIYDKKALEAFSEVDDLDMIVDGSRFPFPNREHIDFCTYALDRLGPVAGRSLLEYGCGSGNVSVYFAKQGGVVSGVDISKEQIAVAKRRAKANGVQVDFRVMPAETLGFPDNSFDLIFGNQVLHHLDLSASAPELRRVLKEGGRAVFCEPVFFLGNLVKRLRSTALGERIFPREVDTPTEVAITMEDISVFQAHFDEVRYKAFQAFTRLHKWISLNDGAYSRLVGLDRFLLDHSSIIRRRLPRFFVIELFKR